MKLKSLALALVSTAALSVNARDVVLKVESVGGKTHWEPERVEVVQGETFHLKAENNLATGFAFHGLEIPALDVHKQVDRNQAVEMDVTIPKDMKPGEYPIRCQFHAAHVGSTLVVKPAKAGATTPTSAPTPNVTTGIAPEASKTAPVKKTK